MPSKFISALPEQKNNGQDGNKPPIYKRKWFIAVMALLVIGMIGSLGGGKSNGSDSSSEQTANAQSVVELKASTEYLEYSNKDIDPTTLVEANKNAAKIEAKNTINLGTVGKQSVTYAITLDNQTTEQEIAFTVRDTKEPIIKLAKPNLSIEQGDTCKPLEAISSVSDEVDGELPYVETAPEAKGKETGLEQFYEQGWYTIEGNVDSSNPGAYKLTIKAVDKHGNTTTKELTVTVKEQPKEEAAPAPAASAATQTYIANTNTGKFHKPGCSAVKKMKDSNKAEFEATRDEMIKKGYEPCQKCNP